MRTRTDRLVADHIEHVRRTARRYWHFPVDQEDLVGAGNEALVKCARQWDPSRSESFWAYAYQRVKGAMLDEMRRWNHVDRNSGTVPDRHLSLDELPEGYEPPALTDSPFPGDLLVPLSEREREVCLRVAAGEDEGSIGASQGCSGSRISQILAKARKRVEVCYG